MCSEADGIPDIPATLVLIIEGERIAGRKPGQAPFVFDGLALSQVLSLVLARKPERAGAASRPRVHRRGWPHAASATSCARSPGSSRAPT